MIVTTPYDGDFDFSTGDFTVEVWIKQLVLVVTSI